MPTPRLLVLPLCLGLSLLAPALCADDQVDEKAPPPLVPWPAKMKRQAGVMGLRADARIVRRDPRLVPLGQVLAREIELLTGLKLAQVGGPPRAGDVVLAFRPGMKGEAYRLTVGETARVEGGTYEAVAMGTVTLLQAVESGRGKTRLPRLSIEDGPRFPYCGAMLDVARKPYSIATLKECVEVCRFYKIRYLHLHLSDENAWVFPSTAYPRLGSKNFAWAGGRPPAVYKLDELKALVAFADERGVTLVPEIETPGHSGQLRGTLPELFGYRDGRGKTVTPGVLNLVREETFEALDIILGEVAAVFRSSPYLHIGGDEVSIAEVEKLPEVTAFMAKHKLTSVHAVFNAFVNRMHGIVKKHGKRMIVWEGAPVEPVPPPKDTVFMPWVGGSGAAAGLVKRGYSVINPPWGVREAYFDPYEVNGARLGDREPLLLGATSILWESPQEAAVPHLRHTGALRNEPTYNPRALRGHADFLRRHRAAEARLDRLLSGVTSEAKGVHDPLVFMRPDPTFERSVTLSLLAAKGKVRFTLDGSEPDGKSPLFRDPIELKRTTTVKARLEGDPALSTWSRTFRRVPWVKHDGVGAQVRTLPDKPGYPGPGAKGLADGLLADGDETGSAGWVGWERTSRPVVVILELKKPTRITRLSAHFLRAAGGVALPKQVEFAVSTDGLAYGVVGSVAGSDGMARRGWYVLEPKAREAKFVLLRISAGGDWSFLDEVMVNGQVPGPTFRHAARGARVKVAHAPSPAYSAPGAQGLTDGHVARSAEFLHPTWLGVEGKNFDATLDLGKVMDVREVGVRFLQSARAGIFVPRTLDVEVSDDGKTFRKAATIKHGPDERPAYIKALSARLDRTRARYVRVVGHTNGVWLFADEVFVNPEASEE